MNNRKPPSGNPQLEDGYMKLANEIVLALMQINLSPYEGRFLWCVFWHTYGWNKKDDWIALSSIAEMTGMQKSHCSRSKKFLLQRNIVTQQGKKISFNKYYSQWNKLPRGVNSHKRTKLLPEGVIQGVPEGVNNGVPLGAPTIYISSQDTTTQDSDLEKNSNPPSDEPAERIIGKLTDAEIETMGEKFREIGMELASWDEHYAQKTWDQRLNLRMENREKYYQKISRIVTYYARKGDRVRALTKKMCFETAGMVNDLGSMEQVLDDKEIKRRRDFAEQESGKAYVESEL